MKKKSEKLECNFPFLSTAQGHLNGIQVKLMCISVSSNDSVHSSLPYILFWEVENYST